MRKSPKTTQHQQPDEDEEEQHHELEEEVPSEPRKKIKRESSEAEPTLSSGLPSLYSTDAPYSTQSQLSQRQYYEQHKASALPGLISSIPPLTQKPTSSNIPPSQLPSVSYPYDYSPPSTWSSPSTQSPQSFVEPTQSASTRSTSSSYSSGLFVLSEQPSARQRKSYPNEHRFLLPNPLSVMRREPQSGETMPTVTSGIVTVRLVNRDGEDLPENKRNILQEMADFQSEGSSSVDRVRLTKPLDVNSLSAAFSLLAMETSEGNMFRLLFNVNYTVVDRNGVSSQREERILSRPFIVYSSRRKNLKEAPIVVEMRPTEGPSKEETECWIKGKGFSERVEVMFGDYPGRIVECAENLITVFAPARQDISSTTTVHVQVSNKYLSELLPASTVLSFTYRVS